MANLMHHVVLKRYALEDVDCAPGVGGYVACTLQSTLR